MRYLAFLSRDPDALAGFYAGQLGLDEMALAAPDFRFPIRSSARKRFAVRWRDSVGWGRLS